MMKLQNANHSYARHASVAVAAIGLTLASCASKSAAVHPAPYFVPTATRQTTGGAVDVGDGDQEIATLRQAVISHPDDVDVRLQLAKAYSAHRLPDVALEHYRLAAERFPASDKAAVQLARALRQAGQKEEALATLKSFLHAHPQTTAEPYEWLGILNDDAAHWKESQLAYETALLYAPASAELHNNLGYSLMMQSLNPAAAAEFRKALRLNKDLVIAGNNLGVALAADPREAIASWQALSGPAAAHNNMAALLIERRDYSGARKELETALGYDQQNAQAIYNLALVSEKDGKPAVLPGRNVIAERPTFKERFLHPWRHYQIDKQSDNPPTAVKQAAAVQTTGRTGSPAGAGSGN